MGFIISLIHIQIFLGVVSHEGTISYDDDKNDGVDDDVDSTAAMQLKRVLLGAVTALPPLVEGISITLNWHLLHEIP